MKTKLALLAVLLCGAAPLAHADSATITVTGKVLPGTCTAGNLTIDLDAIDAVDIKDGHENSPKPGEVTFTGCVGVASIDLTFDGVGDPTQDNHWKNQAATGGANGVAIALLEGTAGNTYLQKGARRTIAVNGAATGKQDLRAAYFHKAGTAMTAGTVMAQITVTADYR